MCGIIGIFNKENHKKLAIAGLKVIDYRGKDAQGFYSEKNFTIAHNLHSMVGSIKQPIKEKGILAANCEIYNWMDLNDTHKLKADNDAQLLLKLLDSKGIDAIKELDGVYALAYINNKTLYLARDLIGIKPLWYSTNDGFAFASEKKALEKLGYLDINELNPRHIMGYDIDKNKLSITQREFFKITPEIKDKESIIKETVNQLLHESIIKRIPNRKFGILFSGGLDSTVMALILKKLGYEFTCYTCILEDKNLSPPQDLEFAKRIAKEYNLDHKVIKIKTADVEKYLKIIIPLIEDYNVVKVGVALTFYKACEQAKKDKCKVIFSGLGSEEIFAGYDRHKKSNNINQECISGLLKMYERDTYRDDVITMFNSLELRLPYLDKQLVEYSLRIPEKFKITNNHEKLILRKVALDLGIKEEYAMRPKKAAQYGSNFHKAIRKLTKKNKYKLMADYLRTFYKAHNLNLGALVSSGKDSIYAMYVMMKQNYQIDCMISIKSKNKDSFMFHTPGIDLVTLQSQATGIPLIEQETKGEKELELNDLKLAIKKAKQEYKIEGIITGALYSNYQRERIEKICDELSLKIFSPLWHINQETEMREILNHGFKFILTKIAAEGLNKSWIGKEITNLDIDKLVKLNEKVGMNIAGEGGEFESLMIDGPIFQKRIEIKKAKTVMEDERTGTLEIEKAELIDK